MDYYTPFISGLVALSYPNDWNLIFEAPRQSTDLTTRKTLYFAFVMSC